MSIYLIQFLGGLAHASTLFLVASGLTLIFGVTRIVNFAHGAFYMLGAYLAYSLATRFMPSAGDALGFWGALVLAALLTGVIGVAMEVVVLRRIYHAPEIFQLLATFGVVLIVQDAALAIWGREDLFAPRAPGLRGAVALAGERLPEYHLFLIVLGPLVLGALWFLTHRTRWGILVRAATEDREMAGALGVNQKLLFTSVLFVGSALAGLGGALQIPKEAVNLQMDAAIIVEAFVVVVIGGLGSVLGAFFAAVLIGQISAFGILLLPKITLVLVFIVMAMVLVVRPHGLFGRPQAQPRVSEFALEPPLAPISGAERALWVVLLALLIAAPMVASEYALVLGTEVLIFAVFAASLGFLMHIGGMVSFGHAAYFGTGAYAAALAVKYWAASMALGLVLAPLAAAALAALFGWFCVRSSGVYLAMLTLAFAQIVWSLAFQSDWSGGDNGILGVWPPAWAGTKTAYYYLTLALASTALVALYTIVHSPFGYALRAGRDSPLRAEAIGIDVRRQQWFAFALAGGFAGLAGGLYVFHKGSVFPNALGIPQSVDGLVMVLLGGVQTLAGPLVGAAAYHLLQTEILRLTEYWRAILGSVIVVLVIVFPQGIVGYVRPLVAARLGTR